MKHLKFLSVILSLALLTACASGQPVQTSETISETETSAAATSTETEAATETETEPVPETEPAEAAEEAVPEYVTVSPNNEFIDYEFIENYQGTTDIGDLADKAVDFLKTTDFYADSMKNIAEFSDEEFADYIEDGVIVPKFSIAYPNDYDGDGRTETFMILKMPSIAHEKSIVRDFIIFSDSGENMEVIDHTLHIALVEFLNYGRDKQIIFGGHGDFGAEELTGLYGVKHGNAVTHYLGRVGFYKSDCFLSVSGWQGSGDFMYYDTAMREYRSIMGDVLTIDEMKKIDKENFFAEYYEAAENDGFAAFLLIGGSYYCLIQQPIMDVGTIYTCEDGKFTLLENSRVRISLNENGLPMVKDIDINKAIAEMKKPTEPYVQVSPNNEFIDYEFIENYQGTTDIGGLANKAVQLVKGTDEYKYFSENISEFSEESLRDTYTYTPSETVKEWAESFSSYIDADGNIQPKILSAFTEDYDGDGRTETFIIVSAAKSVHSTEFLIFADSFGKTEILGEYDNCCVEAFLNYGKNKQLIVGGGSYGTNTHSDIWGVRNGKAVRHYSSRCSYEKADCFLSVSGFQGSDDFLYFDTGALEYRAVAGIKVPAAEIREMDKSGIFADVDIEKYENAEHPWGFRLIGCKYYSLKKTNFWDNDIYTYENGGFVLNENSKIRLSINEHGLPLVKDIDIEKAVAEMKPPAEPYVQVSPNNEFIDYEFIENYQGTTDIGDLADKAIEFVKGTDQYADSMENINKFSYAAIKEIHPEEKYAKEYADKVAPYINSGNIEPLVSAAYTADYDGDGRSETFIVVDIPYIVWSFPDVWSFLLFADSDGNTDPAVIDFYEGYSASMLNYGKNKHLIFCGWDGMHSYASIYGVKDGKPVTLYDHCPGGYFRKTDCFLSAFGLQGTSAFMYFDTVALEYRNIKGVEMSLEEMTELDVSGSLCSHCNTESLNDLPDYVKFHFIKPNYYLIDWGFPGSHLLTYENGVFTYDEDSNITRSSNYNKLDSVAEFDIEKAVAEMRPVQS